MAALVLLLFLGVWSNLRRFGLLARQIGNHDGNGRSSFAEQNTVPELRSVAEDFDRLVDTLRSSADNLRRAAEDNAHAFKTPIAVIRQSLEPLKRIIPGSDGRGPRAIDMIDRSLDRLDGLVSFARRMDEAAADLLEPPRRKVDLSELLEDMLSGYAGLLAERHLHLRLLITPHVVVRAGEDLLETVVENIVENAISFSPVDGSIQVRLARSGTMAVLTVEDEGPGVDPANIERIFERYFSQRDATDAAEHRALDATGTDGGRTVVPSTSRCSRRGRAIPPFRDRPVDRPAEHRGDRRPGHGEEPGRRRVVDQGRPAYGALAVRRTGYEEECPCALAISQLCHMTVRGLPLYRVSQCIPNGWTVMSQPDSDATGVQKPTVYQYSFTRGSGQAAERGGDGRHGRAWPCLELLRSTSLHLSLFKIVLTDIDAEQGR